MSCLSELVLSVYADGELEPEETKEAEAHVAVCARCRSRVEALRIENRMLAEALAEEAPMGRSLLWTGLSALLVAVGLDRAVVWLGDLVPNSARWMNPLDPAWVERGLVSAMLYLTREGPGLFNGMITAAGLAILGAVAFGLLRLLLRRHPFSAAVLAGLFLVAGFAPPARAVVRRHSQGVVSVARGETVDDSLIAGGQTVDIAGTVNGNVFAGAQQVIIEGNVKGDVFSSSQSLSIEGTVDGSVYSFAQDLTISGTVKGSVMAWADHAEVEPAGRVGMDVLIGAGNLSIRGAVGRDVTAGVGTFEALGSIGRNVDMSASQVTLFSGSRVGGNLTAHVHKKQDVDIESGATIAGKTDIRVRKPGRSRYRQAHFYFWQAVQLGAAFLLGLVLFWLFPEIFGARLDTMRSVLTTGGIGALVLIITPIAAVIVGITLVGLPVALIAVAFWGMALYLAKVFVAAVVGRGLVKAKTPGAAFALALLAGLIIFFVAVNLPYIGGWIDLAVILLGIGIAFTQWRRLRRSGRAATA